MVIIPTPRPRRLHQRPRASGVRDVVELQVEEDLPAGLLGLDQELEAPGRRR